MRARAYYSDPEYSRTFLGRWIWIYRGKGWLDLKDGNLHFSSRALNLELIPKQVHSVALGTFPRTAKPIPLHFLDLSFTAPAGEPRHVFLVPLADHRSAWLTSVWKLNRVGGSWLAALHKWLAEPSASPNVGPAAAPGNSEAREGRPPVS